MTPELEHILLFLIKFIDKNYDKLDNDFRTVGQEYIEPLSKDELIAKLKEKKPIDIVWCFTEGLTNSYEDGDYIEEITVYEDPGYNFCVYEVSDKFIKHSVGDRYQDYFEFVEKKTKVIDYFE